MRKFIYITFLMFVILLSVLVLFSCKNGIDGLNYYTVEFIWQTEGGRLAGEVKQSVIEGGSTKSVKAIANDGYYFAGWADQTEQTDESVKSAERIVENVTENCTFLALFNKVTITVTYMAGDHGTVEGHLSQSIKFNEDATVVTAVPNQGYRFVNWSDGVTTAMRSDKSVKVSKTVTANFELITNVYVYDYNYATGNCDESSVNLTYGELNNAKLIIPVREYCFFGGWFANSDLSLQVGDEYGNIVVDDSIFYDDFSALYAKWTPDNDNVFKLLIVYVTQVDAILGTFDDLSTIHVQHTLSDVEREICHMTTDKISKFLNGLAVTNFQVDEYFTTQTVTEEHINNAKNTVGERRTSLFAYNIPEVVGMLADYDSVLVSFSLNDYKNSFDDGTGAGDAKYCFVHLDDCLSVCIINNEPITSFLDEDYWRWDSYLEPYLHEFAHSVELKINAFPFHDTFKENISGTDTLLTARRYFLNRSEANGQLVGIPYDFWAGNYARIEYEVYESYSGYILNSVPYNIIYDDYKQGSLVQYVIYGKDMSEITAIAHKGYKFVRWSDGLTTASRQDCNITKDMHLYAIFEKI